MPARIRVPDFQDDGGTPMWCRRQTDLARAIDVAAQLFQGTGATGDVRRPGVLPWIIVFGGLVLIGTPLCMRSRTRLPDRVRLASARGTCLQTHESRGTVPRGRTQRQYSKNIPHFSYVFLHGSGSSPLPPPTCHFIKFFAQNAATAGVSPRRSPPNLQSVVMRGVPARPAKRASRNAPFEAKPARSSGKPGSGGVNRAGVMAKPARRTTRSGRSRPSFSPRRCSRRQSEHLHHVLKNPPSRGAPPPAVSFMRRRLV
jgi:hypothetical protein